MKDLSSLADGSIVFDSSMHGGNTVSVNPPLTLPGTESEATQGIEAHSRPNIDLGPNNDGQLKTERVSGGSVPHTAFEWKKV